MQQIGRYEIQSELNRGVLSATFRGQDTSGNAVAIRTVHITALEDKTERTELRKALLRCGKTQAGLSSRHIAAVRDVVEEQDFVHLVRDFVAAPRLTDLVEIGTPAPTRVAINWLQQLASALDQSHQRDIVHGALWPNNIFVESVPPVNAQLDDSLVRVCDFEVARLVAAYSPPRDLSAEALRFLSPEQIKEVPLTGQADQFALGALAYLLLTGVMPFDADNLATLYFRICKEEPRPLTDLSPPLGAGAAEAVARAMAKSASERFSRCQDFVEALAKSSPVAVSTLDQASQATIPSAVVVTKPLATVDTPVPSVLPLVQPVPVEWVSAVPRKRKSGRTLALAFVLGILLGAGIWVSRYWKQDPPIPVQVADPNRSPSSPPPGDAVPSSTEHAVVPGVKPASNDVAGDSSAARPVPSSPPATPQESAVHPAEPHGVHGLTAVRLVSDPVGARILLDDDDSTGCTAPCDLNLSAGRHTLVATIAGSNPAHRIFVVPADKMVTVVMQQTSGTLLVASFPSGAEVVIDGQNRGQTPVSIRLPAGPHKLAVISDGATRAEQTVIVEGDQIVTKTIRW